MKRLKVVIIGALLLSALLLVLKIQSASAAEAPVGSSTFSVEAFVWRFNEDYPGTRADSEIPLDTVYIKTNDGTNWMNKFDKNANAISGPDSLRTMVQKYDEQGIRTIAWFVPKGTDYQGQLEMAKAVLDTGVDALYADIEPWAGFCEKDCAALADNVWKPLRQQRPEAELGVVYDPRPRHRGPSGLASWMSVSDVAAPMCYWNDFRQSPWNTPDGCINQSLADLAEIVPGSPIQLVPAVPGTATPDEIKTAISTIVSYGGNRMSLWRRGVVTPDVWATIESSRPVPATDPSADLNPQIDGPVGTHPFWFEEEAISLLDLVERYLALGPGSELSY